MRSKAAKINIDCNKRAGEYRGKPEENRKPDKNPVMPTEVKVYFASKVQTSVDKLEDQIMKHRHGEKLRKKLSEKFHWSSANFHSIDWQNHMARQ